MPLLLLDQAHDVRDVEQVGVGVEPVPTARPHPARPASRPRPCASSRGRKVARRRCGRPLAPDAVNQSLLRHDRVRVEGENGERRPLLRRTEPYPFVGEQAQGSEYPDPRGRRSTQVLPGCLPQRKYRSPLALRGPDWCVARSHLARRPEGVGPEWMSLSRFPIPGARKGSKTASDRAVPGGRGCRRPALMSDSSYDPQPDKPCAPKEDDPCTQCAA
jgi:hypothetical protein